jgi:hypothetical protein
LKFSPSLKMSTMGRTSAPLHAALKDNDAVDRVLRPLRMTPSSGPSRRSERGIRAVLASFNLQTQIGLRRLISERYVLEAKMRAAEDRAASTHQPTFETDDMRTLRVAMSDSDYNIKRLVGLEAYPHVMAIFGEPTVADSMKLSVQSEDQARSVEGEKAGRIWRLTLGSVGHRVGAKSQYRYVGHDSPDHRGGRSLVNKLNTKTGEENLSYFETVQLRHGRTRRGSCSFAGVHEEVFGPNGAMRPAPEPQPVYASEAQHDRSGGGFGGGGGYGGGGGDNESSISWNVPPASSLSPQPFVDRRYVSSAPVQRSPAVRQESSLRHLVESRDDYGADGDDDVKQAILQAQRALSHSNDY